MKIQQTADEQYFHSAASKIWKTSDLLFAYFFDCTVFIVIQTHEVELQTCFVSTASSYLIFRLYAVTQVLWSTDETRMSET